MTKPFSVSVPGSVMLMGEHAVLHGQPAIVAAVNKRMSLQLVLREDDRIILRSSLGEYETSLAHFEIEKPFLFVLAAIDCLREQLKQGFELTIDADFSSAVGLGSSAAVTAGTLALLQQYLRGDIDRQAVYEVGLKVIRDIQGMGSGADLAASIYGGVLLYDPVKKVIKKIETNPPLSLIYSGYKTKTADVINFVAERFADKKDELESIYLQIGKCVRESVDLFAFQDWKKLGEKFVVHQQLQDALGVNDEVLQRIIDLLLSLDSVYGAKISGSGLGDCVVALGSVNHDEGKLDEFLKIPIEADQMGIA